MKTLDSGLKRSMFLRGMLLQSCWSYEGQQNLGFLFSLEPALKTLYRDPADFREACARHLEYFNTNPFMSSFAVGVAAGMEEDRAGVPARERTAHDGRIRQLKRALASSLAALGDAFFWGALRPAAAAWGILAWVLFSSLSLPGAALWGILVYLAAFNGPALAARWTGLETGYLHKEGVVAALETLRIPKWTRWVRRAGLAAAVCLVLAALIVAPWGRPSALGAAVLLSAAFAARLRGWSALKIYCAALVLGLAREALP